MRHVKFLEVVILTLREFYKLICKEFNDGEPLEYKWTRSDGYWKVTKQFPMSQDKGMSVHILAKYILEEKKMAKEKKKTVPNKRKKKPYIKYKGD